VAQGSSSSAGISQLLVPDANVLDGISSGNQALTENMDPVYNEFPDVCYFYALSIESNYNL